METIINHVTVPLSSYGDGAKWAGTYNGASQCMGFAYLVMDQIWGLKNTYKATGPFTSVKAKLQSLSPGTMVTFHWNLANHHVSYPYHSIVAAGKTANGILVYDCNYLNDAIVRYREWTWAQIADRFDYITSLQVPGTAS